MTDEQVENPEAVLAELRRAQEDLKVLREQLNTLKTERDALQTQVAELDSDEWVKKALTAETKLGLSKSGLKDADRLIKYVGTEGLAFDDKGNLTGLDERLKELQKDLPELFDPKRRVGGQADIHADGQAKQDPFRDSIRNALKG